MGAAQHAAFGAYVMSEAPIQLLARLPTAAAKATFRERANAVLRESDPVASSTTGRAVVALDSVTAPLRFGADPVTPAYEASSASS